MKKQQITTYVYYLLALVLIIFTVDSLAHQNYWRGISELIAALLIGFVARDQQTKPERTQPTDKTWFDYLLDGLLLVFIVMMILYYLLHQQLVFGAIGMVCLVAWVILILSNIVIGLTRNR